MICGYIRTSTADQLNGIDVQRAAIESRYKNVTWYEEHASGKNTKGRPIFTGLLEILQPGDTLVVAKLDRFARSVSDAVAIVEDLMRRNVNLVILDLNVDFGTPIGKLMFQMLAAIAEFERSLISQRTKDALGVVRNSGKQLGKPSTLDCVQVMKMYHEGGMSIRNIAEYMDTSKSAVHRCIHASLAEEVFVDD